MHFGLTPTCIEKMGGRTQEVTVARYGPILWENGATDSRKLSKCLWGLKNRIKTQRTAKLFKFTKYRKFHIFWICALLKIPDPVEAIVS